MGEISTLFVLGSIVVYVIATAAFAVDLAWSTGTQGPRTRRRAAGIGLATTTVAAALHAVGFVLRAIAAERVPWADMFEFTLAFTLVAVVTFLVIQRRRDVRYLGVFVSGLAMSALLLGVLVLYTDADGVQPALDSYWLAIHVSIAATSTGLFSVSAVTSVLQLVKHRAQVSAERRTEALAGAGVATGSSALDSGPDLGTGADTVTVDGSPGAADTRTGGRLARWAAQLPEESVLERFAYRLNAVAFVGWTLVLVTGAIWAEHAWGRPWGWDPKETWSLVIWLVYAAYLHVRATVGWASHKFAYFAIVGFIALLANFYVVNIFFAGKHSYAGI